MDVSDAGRRTSGRRAAGAAGTVGAFGLAAIMALAGCSGGGKTSAAATGAASSATASATAGSTSAASGGAADFQQYAQCLQQHGVTLPSGRPSFSRQPGASGSPRPRPTGSFSRRPGGGFLGSANANPTVQAAMQACASLRPQGGGFARRSLSPTTLAAFKSCMSDNGVTITGTDAQQVLRSLNRDDPKTAAALKICQPIIGSASGSGNPAASPSP